MAIEIISKSKVKEAPWLKITLFIILPLFLVFLLSYSFLIFYQTKLEKKLSELERKLVKTPTEKTLEENLLAIKKKIDDWKFIVARSPQVLKVFEFLEKNTHPQVWFSDFQLNFLEKTTINLNGRAKSFEALDQQSLIFTKQEMVKEVTPSKVSGSKKEEEIIFELYLDLNPKFFQPAFSQEIK